MELDDVIQVLSKHSCLKAKDILANLPTKARKGFTKTDLNSLLYKYENKHFHRNDDYSWTLIEKKTKRKTKNLSAGESSNFAGSNLFHVQGYIEKILPQKQGVHNNRAWQRLDFLIKNFDGEILILSAWNDRIKELRFEPGDRITAYFKIKTKMDKGRFRMYLNAEHVVRL